MRKNLEILRVSVVVEMRKGCVIRSLCIGDYNKARLSQWFHAYFPHFIQICSSFMEL